MVSAGLEKEAKKLPKTDTIGYKEWYGYFDGKITKKQVMENIKRNTEHFAKRQMTWFKRDKNIHWVKNKQEAEILVNDFLYI